jgi:hypothetical protein
MRKSTLFFLYLSINLFISALLFAHAFHRQRASLPSLREKAEMVRSLRLSDVCLFTEASYTRHLSQADLHTPFQDSPMSLEHFPSGSIFPPPRMIKGINEKVD